MPDPAPTVLPIEDFAASAHQAELHHLDVIAALLARVRELKRENTDLKGRLDVLEKRQAPKEADPRKSQHIAGEGAMDVAPGLLMGEWNPSEDDLRRRKVAMLAPNHGHAIVLLRRYGDEWGSVDEELYGLLDGIKETRDEPNPELVHRANVMRQAWARYATPSSYALKQREFMNLAWSHYDDLLVEAIQRGG